MYETDPINDLTVAKLWQGLEAAETDFSDEDLEPIRAQNRNEQLVPVFEQASLDLSVPHVVIRPPIDPTDRKWWQREWLPVADETPNGLIVFSAGQFWRLYQTNPSKLPVTNDPKDKLWSRPLKLTKADAQGIAGYFESRHQPGQMAGVLAPPNCLPVLLEELKTFGSDAKQIRTLMRLDDRATLPEALWSVVRRYQNTHGYDLTSLRFFLDGEWHGF